MASKADGAPGIAGHMACGAETRRAYRCVPFEDHIDMRVSAWHRRDGWGYLQPGDGYVETRIAILITSHYLIRSTIDAICPFQPVDQCGAV